MAKRSRRPVTPRPTTTPVTPTPDTTPLSADTDAEAIATPTPATTTPAVGAPTARARTRNTRSGRTAVSRRAMAQPSFYERNRALIIGGVAVIGLLVIGYFVLVGNQTSRTFAATGLKYTCDSLLTPGPSETLPASVPPPTPTPPTASPLASSSPAASLGASSVPSTAASSAAAGSPAASVAATAGASNAASPATSAPASASASPEASPVASAEASGSPAASATPAPAPTLRLGFTTSILGRDHSQNANETINYGFCPPTSGRHYNLQNIGPIRAAVYPNSAEQPPGGWVHNLEHGWVVLLYSCKNGCPSDAEMAQMQQWYDQSPGVDPAQGCDKEVLVARFDSMTTRFGLVAWGRALLTDEFNLDTAKTFAQQWQDAGSEPEKSIC